MTKLYTIATILTLIGLFGVGAHTAYATGSNTTSPKECKLEITKSANKTTVEANGSIEYTINVRNVGTADCTGGGVKIVDVLDPGLTYVSETHKSNITGGYGSDPVYKASDHTLRFNGNTLNPGESGWITWTATAKTPSACSTVVPNKAKVTAKEYNNFGTWVESNTVNVTVTKDCTPPPPVLGCINIIKETYNTTGAPLTPVAQFSFKLDGATTTQNDASGNAVFMNVAPGAHQVTEVSAGTTWTLLSVTPVLGNVTVPSGSTCAAVVFKNQQVIPPSPKECKLEITKSANKTTVEANGSIEYTINVRNVGTADCTGGGVKIVDVLDPGLTYVSETHKSNITGGYGSDPVYKASDHTLRFNGNTLNPGESGWITWTATAKTPSACSTVVPNKAKVTAKEYNNFGTWVESNTVNVTVTKDCTPPPPVLGCINIIKETYNTTGAPLTPVAQFSFKLDGATTTQNDASGNAVFMNVAPGAHQVTEVSAGTTWTLLSVTPVLGNVTVPSGSTCAAVVFKNQQVIPPSPKECKLEITKSANKTTVEANGSIEYTINVRNVGTADCTGGGVKIVDVLDPGLTYVSETHKSNITGGYGSDPVYKASDHTLRFNGNTLNPGESGWITWTATAKTPSACSTVVPNKAKVTAKEYNNFGTWVESNTVNVTVTKDCTPPPSIPSCTLDVSEDSLEEADDVLLSWTTNNASTFTINHSIGAVTPIAAGSVTAAVATTKTFTGTATGPGGTVTCTKTVTVAPPVLSCALSISNSPILTGGSTTISWSSSNATAGSINNNVGAASPVSLGSSEIFPPSTTVYTGTFGNGVSTTTCSATVIVTVGGGGCQGNCGGGLNPPTVTLAGKPGNQPLAFVYLSQVPYTGFEAGAFLTILFWLAVAIWSAGITYVLVGRGSIRLVAEHLFAYSSLPSAYSAVGSWTSSEREDQPSVSLSIATPMPVASIMPMPAASIPATDSIDDISPQSETPELSDVIESRAHAAGVLLSPESVGLATSLSDDRETALRIFGNIVNEAVTTIPREDGWILLSSDRFRELSERFGLDSATTEHAAKANAAVVAVMSENVATRLASAIATVDRESAFSLVRDAEAEGIDSVSLMTGLATAFDRALRARHGGEAGDLMFAEKAVELSDEKLSALVTTFAHALDQKYATPYTGVKLAVAQAFEAL